MAASTTVLRQAQRITGDISPKSVVASPLGLVIAQNMMYTHTVTAYRPDGALAATIDDGVDLADLRDHRAPGRVAGRPGGGGVHRATAATPTCRTTRCTAPASDPRATTRAHPQSGYDDSYTYRIDTETFAIDQAIKVGAVPKYVAVTPDDTTVLVTNWCTYDLSVIDVASAREVHRIPIGAYPRGIVVSPDSRTAYVAVMGGDVIVRVDLATQQVTTLLGSGDAPRHLLISPDGSALFVSHNHSNTVVRIDAATGAVTHSVSTGSQPRSMAISADGSAIYVVNYESSTVTKLRADDLTELDEQPTDHHPIGITYEPTTATRVGRLLRRQHPRLRRLVARLGTPPTLGQGQPAVTGQRLGNRSTDRRR